MIESVPPGATQRQWSVQANWLSCSNGKIFDTDYCQRRGDSRLVSSAGCGQDDEVMKAETLRRLIETNPFRPFTVNLAGGRALRVPHRDCISHSPNFRTLTIWREDDSADFVDLMPVIGFHAGKLRRNGHSRVKSSK